ADSNERKSERSTVSRCVRPPEAVGQRASQAGPEMIPDVFQYATASAAVTALLGTSPTRFWPFSSAPHADQAEAQAPYAVWQLVYGLPENNLSTVPDVDNSAIQVDAYGRSATEARNVMLALRDAFEPHGHVTAYNG